MKHFKKVVLLMLVSFLAVSGYPNLSKATELDNSKSIDRSCGLDEIIINDKTKKQSVNENGIETIEITDPEVLEKIESNIGKKYADKKLRSFTIQRDTRVIDQLQEQNEITPLAIGASVKQTGSSDACGTNTIGYTSGRGPINLSISDEVTTQVTGGFGVNLNVINASLGTSITETKTVISSTSYTAPNNNLGVIEAYPALKIINFDAYYLGIKTGSGSVTYGVGVCFNKYY